MRNAHAYSVVSVIRPALTAAACLVAAHLAAPSPVQAHCVVVKVNGEAIANDEIEQRTKFTQLADHKSPPRKETIEELIDDKLKVQIARRYKIDITEKDVNQEYAAMAKRMHWSPEQLTQALSEAGLNVDTIKAKILADMRWQSIIRGKFQQLAPLDEKHVTEVDSQKKGSDAEASYDYTFQGILFLVPSGNAPLMDARRKDADALRTRFASCEAGLAEARAQPDVVIRPLVTKNSFDFPPALRDLLSKIEVGHLTPPETTTDGIEVYALCAKKERSASEVLEERRAAHGKVFARKFDALSKAYLRELRRAATIEFMQRCRPRLR
jgi:peptidyl-prolyl cis-trans isomerase SurA